MLASPALHRQPAGFLVASILAALLLFPAALSAREPIPVNDETVKEAVRQAVKFLWSEQNDEGHWDLTEPELKKRLRDQIERVKETRRAEGPSKVKAAVEYLEKNFMNTINRDRSGETALALLALLHAGEDPKDPRFEKGLRWMVEIEPTGTYALGLRCSLWAALRNEKIFKLLEKEALTLQNGIWPYGTYSYTMRPADKMDDKPIGDFSNNQYGLLGVWAGSEGNVEIHPKYWKLAEHGYLASQNKDGGWPYPVTDAGKGAMGGESRAALSLGGIASLYVIWDKFYAHQGCDAKVNPELVQSLSHAIKWVGEYYDEKKKSNYLAVNPYELYALERAGVASGLKYFGNTDWYLEGAGYAINHQSAQGSWSLHSATCGTAWTVLFLEFGRAPVVYNKLAHGNADDWNARPRDLARLTQAMGRVYERKFNWQVMPITASAHDLQDAPVLYISGKRPLSFTDEQKKKLRSYVDHGGVLLFAPSGRGSTFSQSVDKLVLELFPDQEMVQVPADAPLFTAQFKIDRPIPVFGLFNGIRWTVLKTDIDLSCPWQQYQIARHRDLFDVAFNLYIYVSDTGQLKGRGQSYLVADKGNKPASKLTIGRLIWGSRTQSDPEPAAWGVQDIRMRNAGLMGLDVVDVDANSGPIDPAAIRLLHVTGVAPLVLSDKAKANLAAYISGGGLLLADPAGGSEAFAASFRKLMDEVLGERKLVPLPQDAPFLSDGTEDGKVWYRHLNRLPRTLRPVEMMVHSNDAGNIDVIFMPSDLSSAMVGYPSLAPVGLTPESADRLLTAILKWRASGKPASATPPNNQPE